MKKRRDSIWNLCYTRPEKASDNTILSGTNPNNNSIVHKEDGV